MVISKNQEILLIDHDNLSSFGVMRIVGTPKMNCHLQSLMMGEIVN